MPKLRFRCPQARVAQTIRGQLAKHDLHKVSRDTGIPLKFLQDVVNKRTRSPGIDRMALLYCYLFARELGT